MVISLLHQQNFTAFLTLKYTTLGNQDKRRKNKKNIHFVNAICRKIEDNRRFMDGKLLVQSHVQFWLNQHFFAACFYNSYLEDF